MDDLASNIKDRRKSLGLTQDELAEKADMPNRTFQNYETGRRSIPSNILPKIAKALECTVADLYKEPNPVEKDAASLRKAINILVVLNQTQLQRAITVLESLSRSGGGTPAVKKKKSVS